jgi:hypothetical protein
MLAKTATAAAFGGAGDVEKRDLALTRLNGVGRGLS